MIQYETVRTFSSKSKKDKVYTVKRRNDGMLTCDCPVWVFNRQGDRTCYHTVTTLLSCSVIPSENLSFLKQKEKNPIKKMENGELKRKIRFV